MQFQDMREFSMVIIDNFFRLLLDKLWWCHYDVVLIILIYNTHDTHVFSDFEKLLICIKGRKIPLPLSSWYPLLCL